MPPAFILSGAPFEGSVAGLRVGLDDGQLAAFMEPETPNASELDLVVAGTATGVMMVEAGASEV